MKVLIIDTETTDLVKNHTMKLDLQASVIEFAGVLCNLKTGTVYEELNILICPPKPITEQVTKITGITNDMVKDAPSFKQVSDKIFRLIEKAPLVIAHNASFDKEILELEAERLKYELHWPHIVCSVEQTIGIKGFRLDLTTLYDHLFKEKFEAHRANVDVTALRRCCEQLYKQGIL